MLITVNSVGADTFPPTIEMHYTIDSAIKDKNCKNLKQQMSLLDFQLVCDTLNFYHIDFDITENEVNNSIMDLTSLSFSDGWDSEEEDYWNQYL